MIRTLGAITAAVLATAVVAAPAAAQTEVLATPSFGRVAIYSPTAAPTEVVLFLSGDSGWTMDAASMAARLRDRGALVVGIDTRAFVRGLEESQGCAYPAGDLEELSRNVQLHRRLPAYKRPILVGYSSGATLAYAAIASAPAETFAGAIGLAFCPDLVIRTPLCEMRGLSTRKRAGDRYDVAPFQALAVPWLVLQGEQDKLCTPASLRAFVAGTGSARLVVVPRAAHGLDRQTWAGALVDGVRSVVDARRPDDGPRVTIPEVEDLSLVEVPATGRTDSDLMAIVMTGDGGWAELDKGVSAALARSGVPCIGWSSLRYFWTPRSPDQAATDLARVMTHYLAAWNKRRVVLVGYSFGADVIPFLVNRLPAALRGRLAGVGLLGLSPSATFEFHIAEWIGGAHATEYRTVPEVDRLSVPVTCIRGAGESDSACGSLHGSNVTSVTVGEGHHFSGDYQRLAEEILGHL